MGFLLAPQATQVQVSEGGVGEVEDEGDRRENGEGWDICRASCCVVCFGF